MEDVRVNDIQSAQQHMVAAHDVIADANKHTWNNEISKIEEVARKNPDLRLA